MDRESFLVMIEMYEGWVFPSLWCLGYSNKRQVDLKGKRSDRAGAGDDYDREPRAKRMMIQGGRMVDDEGCQDMRGSDAGAAGIVCLRYQSIRSPANVARLKKGAIMTC